MYGGSAIGDERTKNLAGRPRVDPNIFPGDELDQARTHRRGGVRLHLGDSASGCNQSMSPLGAFVGCELCWKMKLVPRGYGEAPPRLCIVVCC